MQANEQVALMLWQGREMVKLHTDFINHLKLAILMSPSDGASLDAVVWAERILRLESLCNQVLQQETIPK